VGDFAVDTAIEGGDGRYRATLSSDWEIWGPNGGYVATIALRAAGAASRFARPASFTGQFLSVAKFEDVHITVEVVRSTRVADSLLVRMSQGDRPVHIALVWTVDELDGLVHDIAPMPDAPPPEDVTPGEEITTDRPMFPFWQNLDHRHIDWNPDRLGRAPTEPRFRGWYRFRPRATFEDPYVDAGRALLLLDTLGWPAAVQAHVDPQFLAPSLDVNVQFHRLAPSSEWIYVDEISAVGADGLIGCSGRAWSRSGELLASGSQQLLCRPRQQIMPENDAS
jgi:acyl-CoA thioesterase II